MYEQKDDSMRENESLRSCTELIKGKYATIEFFKDQYSRFTQPYPSFFMYRPALFQLSKNAARWDILHQSHKYRQSVFIRGLQLGLRPFDASIRSQVHPAGWSSDVKE